MCTVAIQVAKLLVLWTIVSLTNIIGSGTVWGKEKGALAAHWHESNLFQHKTIVKVI